jgi:hypothetical protein
MRANRDPDRSLVRQIEYLRSTAKPHYRPTLRTAITSSISLRASATGTFPATWRNTVISAAVSPTIVVARTQSARCQLEHFAKGYCSTKCLPLEQLACVPEILGGLIKIAAMQSHWKIALKYANEQTTLCNIWHIHLRYVALYAASCGMTLIYAVLFFACLVGVCALVLIGDKVRSVYIGWLGSTDLILDEPIERLVFISNRY